jgi:hypothetical protein
MVKRVVKNHIDNLIPHHSNKGRMNIDWNMQYDIEKNFSRIKILLFWSSWIEACMKSCEPMELQDLYLKFFGIHLGVSRI